MIPKYGLNEWDALDKPIEKFNAQGASSLTNEELLSIIIGSGTANRSSLVISEQLLEQAKGSLVELARMTPWQIQQVNGIGFNKAVTIAAALELGRRRQADSVPKQAKIIGSADIQALFQPLLSDIPHEELWVVLLTGAKRIIEKYRLSTGSLTQASLDIRSIMRRALDHMAVAIILVHNHPSGDVAPSEEDIRATRQLKAAASHFDIKVPDHIIIGDGVYFSMAEHGLL